MNRATKQRLLSFARTAGILPALDAGRFVTSKWRSASENSQFRDAHPDFAPPPLWWMHDMYRHTSFDLYWRTGVETAAAITGKIDRYVTGATPRVADWGCGLARVTRHLPSRLHRYGFDYNAHAIKWCREQIPDIEFNKNELLPPLPADDQTFDALYALSVFTHLSQSAHEAWINEIERVLAPGGVFLGAFHMEPPEGQLLPAEQDQFDAGQLVVRGGVKEGTRTFTAYHPESYLRETLLHNFDVLEEPADLFGQTLFISRRR